MPISRRSLLGAIAGGAGLAMTGCTITSSGGVTTATLNTATVADYANAVLSFARTALGISLVTTALGAPATAAITLVVNSLANGITAFNEAAGGSVTVSLDDASVKSAFDSILADAKNINSVLIKTIQQIATSDSSTVLTNIQTAANAASSVISLLQAMAASLSKAPSYQTALLKDDGRDSVATINRWVQANR